MMKDCVGNELSVGDVVVYPVKWLDSTYTKIGKVVSFNSTVDWKHNHVDKVVLKDTLLLLHSHKEFSNKAVHVFANKVIKVPQEYYENALNLYMKEKENM